MSLVAVALLVLGVVGWLQLRDRIDDQATEAAGTCVEGDAELHIAADPLIARTLTDLAATWNTDVAPVIRDYCITAHVTATESPTAATALATDTWNPELGPEPALWVPVDTRAADRAGTSASGQRRSLAISLSFSPHPPPSRTDSRPLGSHGTTYRRCRPPPDPSAHSASDPGNR